MIEKKELKKEAIRLRKAGKSYGEILSRVPVAKSTLSIWLRSVGLAKAQKQRLTLKKLEAGRRGGLAKKNQRIKISREIREKAKGLIGKLSEREKFLIGVVLHWAEGSKEKEYHPGSPVVFMNSDSHMIRVFLEWLLNCCHVSRSDITFEIYIHETKRESIHSVRRFWSKTTGFPLKDFNRIYWKKNKILTKRKNTGDLYYGNLRVRVKASSTLNRQITGSIQGVYEQFCGIV